MDDICLTKPTIKITEIDCDFSPVLFKYIFSVAKVFLVMCNS